MIKKFKPGDRVKDLLLSSLGYKSIGVIIGEELDIIPRWWIVEFEDGKQVSIPEDHLIKLEEQQNVR